MSVYRRRPNNECSLWLQLVFAVPLYFQVTQKVSNTVAGAHLFPAVFGNAIGGLVTGRLIKR